MNSETDFVARNAEFQTFVEGLSSTTLSLPIASSEVGAVHMDVPSLLRATGAGGAAIEQELANLVAKIRENITVKRATRLSVPDGLVTRYDHQSRIDTCASAGVRRPSQFSFCRSFHSHVITPQLKSFSSCLLLEPQLRPQRGGSLDGCRRRAGRPPHGRQHP